MLLEKPARGEWRRRRKAEKKAARSAAVKETRPAIFERASNVCECCRRRRAESMHETKPVSIGGKISTDNSVAVCGSGTTGCHGHLQAYRIKVTLDENGRRVYTPTRPVAERWMRGLDQ